MARTRSRRYFDMILAAVFAPIWLVCLVLHLDLQLKDRISWFPIYVMPASDTQGFPEFRAYWPDVSIETRTLEPSDRLIEFGGMSLQGASRLDVLAAAYAAAQADHGLDALVERGGQRRVLRIELAAHSFPWRTVPLAVGLAFAAFFALV